MVEQLAQPDETGRRARLTVDLQADLPQGIYLVSWQNLSVDGDGMTGRYSFGVGMTPPNGGSPSQADMLK